VSKQAAIDATNKVLLTVLTPLITKNHLRLKELDE